MKHAFLIIAHNEYPILEVLLSMLDDERNDIYLHIDKRAVGLYQKIKGFKIKKAGFYLIEKNMKVYWGDISLVKVEYLLFETALKTDLMPIITYCQEQTFLSKAKTTFMNSFIKIQERSSSASGKMQPTNGIWNAKYPDIIFSHKD